MEQKVIWFMKGYANLYHAISDIKRADADKKFKVLCTHPSPSFIGYEAADYFEVEPALTGKALVNYCLKMVKKYKVNVIFTSNRQSLFSKNAQKFKELGAEVLTASNSKYATTINNKGKLYNFFKKDKEVNVPGFELFYNSQTFDKALSNLKTQYDQLCVKPTIGVYGKGFYALAKSQKELKQYPFSKKMTIKKFKEKIKGSSIPRQLLMQYLEGYERSVDGVAYNGQLVGAVIRKKISSSLPQIVEDNPAIMKQVLFIVQKLKMHGLFNIQFKDCGDEHFLLEINPRLSGRSYYATLAGVNLPYIASLLFSGLKKPEDIKVSVNHNLKIANINTGVVVQNASSWDYSKENS